MYREGGHRPNIRWQVPKPKKEEGELRIILEWMGSETDGVWISKYKARDRELVRRVEFDGGVSWPITEHAPAPLPVEPSPETTGPHIHRHFAPLVRRMFYDADVQDEVDERKLRISWRINNNLAGYEPDEPEPQIRKRRTEPKEPAPSPQPVPKANLRPILTGLPEDLSWDMVLALVLPEEHILWPRIDMLRRAYDRHYYQGIIPHIKLYVLPSLCIWPGGLNTPLPYYPTIIPSPTPTTPHLLPSLPPPAGQC